jgi:uncharacterized protein YlxW (UPF0749 family)
VPDDGPGAVPDDAVPDAVASNAAGPDPVPGPAPVRTGFPRVLDLLTSRPGRGSIVVGLLFGLLGFALVVQLGSSRGGLDLATARQSDLVRILDDVSNRQTRLQTEADDLESTRRQLAGGVNSQQVAVEEAQTRAQTLGILAGTVAATGPGIEVRLVDPQSGLDAATLLDVVEELRDAGAEAIQVGGVRVVAQTAFTDGTGDKAGTLLVDGQEVARPVVVLAVGDSRTMSAALRIPGGVVDTMGGLQGDALIRESTAIVVSALRPLQTPRYAKPSGAAQ